MAEPVDNQKSVTGFTSAAQVESAFYQAFAACSVQGMDAVWANDKVICIHPGSTALIGRDAVMKSWARILMSDATPNIRFENVNKVENENLAVHLVREIITVGGGSAVVIATNIYQKGDSGWKMIEHHGSQPIVEHRAAKLKPAPEKKRVLQ